MRLTGDPVPGHAAPGKRTTDPRRIVGRFVVANTLAVVLLLGVGLVVSRAVARDEALLDARRTTDLLATAVVEPLVGPRVLAGEPGALGELDDAIRTRVLDETTVRVKIWTADGTIVYSDEPELIGTTFPLGEEQLAAMADGVSRAELSSVSRPENQFEQAGGSLLEVYRPIRAVDGTPLLFETYARYDSVASRARDIWVAFAPISVLVVLVLALVQIPLARRMLRQLQHAQDERELLLRRAVDASLDERRRIAGHLHDGVVQDLAGASYVLAGAMDRTPDRTVRAEDLEPAAAAVRQSIRALRTMLVEIYPPSLRAAGLGVALGDLAGPLRARGLTVDVQVDLPAGGEPPEPLDGLIFRVAQEALRNVVKHARASRVLLRLTRTEGRLELTVTDDGVGFDAGALRARAADGHVGLLVMADLAAQSGATLDLRSALGRGTSVRMLVEQP